MSFDESVSPVSALTCEVAVSMPGSFGTTDMSTLAVPALARLPSSQVTAAADGEQVPWEALAVPNVTPAGSSCATVTASALEGPRFSTSIS